VKRQILARLSYANVISTLALFIALGGTSYAVLAVGSNDVIDNSLRSRDIRNGSVLSRDIRNGTIRARDVDKEALGSRVIKESALGRVPRAVNADRLGGVSAQELLVTCPPDTLSKAGICIETSARGPVGWVSAIDECSRAGRQLITMAELDLFARSNGPLPQPEWTSSVYRNPDNGPSAVEQLEAVLLQGGGNVSYDRVHLAVQHAFRCVASRQTDGLCSSRFSITTLALRTRI
jgi:hypothetical protein